MKESNEEKKARLAERKRLKPSVGEFLKKRVDEALAEGKTQITFDELTDGKWSEEPLLSFAKTWAGKNAKVWTVCSTGAILYHQMKADGRFNLSYYEKKEDPKGRARLYILKGATNNTSEEVEK